MTATRQRRTSPWKPIMARMAALLSEAFAAVLTCRHARAARFRHPSDWLRLTLLAGLILTFAVFAIAEALASPRRIFTDFSGSETLFAGLAIILFIGKIGRPQIYFDWLLFGATHAGIGLSLLPPEDTASTFSPLAFSGFLIASGALRIWVGLTADPPAAGGWITSSGCVGLLSGAAVAIAQVWKFPLPALNVVALDLLLLGIAIAGFALTLRESK